MGFAPTWLRQASPPLLHKTTLTTVTNDDQSVIVVVQNRHRIMSAYALNAMSILSLCIIQVSRILHDRSLLSRVS